MATAKVKPWVPISGEINEFSGLLNTAVHERLLNVNEAKKAVNLSVDDKGTLRMCKGLKQRYASDFGASPVAGIGEFTKDDVSTLLIGAADGKLYKDTPHLVNSYNSQADWNTGTHNLDASSSPGDLKIPVVQTGEELLINPGFETGYGAVADSWAQDTTVSGVTLTYSLDTASKHSGSKSQKAVLSANTGSATGVLGSIHQDVSLTPGLIVALSVYFAITGASVGVKLSYTFLDANNTSLGTGSVSSAFGTADWGAQLSLVTTAAPAGTVKARITLAFNTNAVVTSGTVWFDDASVMIGGNAFSRASVAYKQDGTQVAAGVPRYEDTNLIPSTKRTFSTGWLAYSGATVTVTQNQTVSEWNTNTATRIQTSGGTGTLKYLLSIIAPSVNGVYYSERVQIKNIGTKTVRVSINFSGKYQDIASGAVVNVVIESILGNGTTDLQMRFEALNAGDALDFYAYQPQAEARPYISGWPFDSRMLMVEEGSTNLANYSDQTDLAQFASYGNVTIAAAGAVGSAFSGGAVFGDNSVLRYAYPGATLAASTTYTVSVFVRMDDSGAPVVGTSSTSGDFGLVLAALFITSSATVVNIGGGLYRVSVTATTGTSPAQSFGVAKYTTQSARTFKVSGFQVEQKSYATSYVKTTGASATRAAETLPIPNAGVWNKGNWTVEFWFEPTSNQVVAGKYGRLWNIFIDDSNYYVLVVDPSGKPFLRIVSGGTVYDAGNGLTPVLSVGSKYHIAVRGNGSTMALLVNGTKYGGDVAYVEPVGSLPANMYIGSLFSGIAHANGIFDDLRNSSKARTDAEINAVYSGGQPQAWDVDTTYLLAFDGNLNNPIDRSGNWISPVIDALFAVDKASGKAILTADIPGSSSIAIESCSAPASGGPWSSWVAALADGTLQHAVNSFVKVRLKLHKVGTNSPTANKLVVSFDGTPTATLLASDFTPGGQFYFATLLDTCGIVNGLDAPRKYDGTTLSTLGGSPPSGAWYIAKHKNRIWMAKGSRIYYSDLLNIETWNALSFIDINPNDGDKITGFFVTSDYLVITKSKCVALLLGDSPDNFSIRIIHTATGNIAPRSLVMVNSMLSFIADNGINMSDFSQTVLATERIRPTWDNMNKRRRNQAAAVYYNQKHYTCMPDENSINNNIWLVFDTLNKCWSQRNLKPVSCWLEYVEAGMRVMLAGDATKGQVYEIETGTDNAGAAFEMEWISKMFDLGAGKNQKSLIFLLIDVVPAVTDTALYIDYYLDGSAIPITQSVFIAGATNPKIVTYQVQPSLVNVVPFTYLNIGLRQTAGNGGVAIQRIEFQYFIMGPSVQRVAS